MPELPERRPDAASAATNRYLLSLKSVQSWTGLLSHFDLVCLSTSRMSFVLGNLMNDNEASDLGPKIRIDDDDHSFWTLHSALRISLEKGF